MDEQYKKDAEDMRKAMAKSGTDEEALINIVSKRTLEERLKIKEFYINMFGRDLIEDLKSELSGKLEDAFIALFTDLAEYDADCIKKAVKGLGTDEDTIIEILGTRPSWFIKKIKEKYLEKYKVELEKDIIDDTSGSFKKLLVALIACGRKSNKVPDVNECEKIAQELSQNSGKNQDVFIKYFSNSSPHELLQIARSYHKLTNNLLSKAIDKEFSGDFQKLLSTILYSNISPSEYFAYRIFKAIDGIGTNNKSLIRIVIGRSDIDIPIIKQYYKQLYNKDMVEDIKGDISGDYKKLIEALLTR